jgi:hypothetical protein
MTPEQRTRLVALLPAMKAMAWRQYPPNARNKALNLCDALQDFLHGNDDTRTAEEWIAIAEKAAEGHDKPGIVRMPSMAAVLSGMPPEHKED